MAKLPPIDLQDDWIDHNPLGMLALDENGRVQWLNHTLLDLLDMHRDELTALPRPTGILATLLEGDGSIELEHKGKLLCLRRQERRMQADDGAMLRVVLFEDLREISILQQEIATLRETLAAQSLEDPLTGLPNQRGFRQLLEMQVTRSRRYNNPLSLVAVRLQAQNLDTAMLAELPDGAVLAAAQSLRERLRWADSVGRWDDETFMIALPETSLGNTQALIDKVEKGLIASQSLINQRFPVRVRFGQAGWKPRMDARGLLDSVLLALDSNGPTLSLTG